MPKARSTGGRQASIYLSADLVQRIEALRDRGVEVDVPAACRTALVAQLLWLEAQHGEPRQSWIERPD